MAPCLHEIEDPCRHGWSTTNAYDLTYGLHLTYRFRFKHTVRADPSATARSMKNWIVQATDVIKKSAAS